MTVEIDHRRIAANGITFHVAVSGEEHATRPAIFCVHGFPEGWMSWRPVMAALGGQYPIYAIDLRGYPDTQRPPGGYDVFTLTDDLQALIDKLQLDRPLLLTHDWGGALGWIFAHRYASLIRQLLVVNCTHPKTLVRAVLTFADWQTLRIPWVPFFMVPWLPEACLTTALGRQLLRLTFTLREGRKGAMDRALVDEIIARFRRPDDLRGPIEYYREMVWTQLLPRRRAQLKAVYRNPISVPVTLIWGEVDRALSARVAKNSGRDAGCPVEWRPLPGVGHFVGLEASDLLVREVSRALEAEGAGGERQGVP